MALRNEPSPNKIVRAKGFLDAAHVSLRIGVRISLQMRRMATLKVDVSE
jgi:hypothetical protein